MTTIEKMLIDLDPDTLVRQVMSDPNHQARVRARTERERKAYQTETEKALQAEKAGRKKDCERFHQTLENIQEQVTLTLMKKNAATVAFVVCALYAGYCLAFV